MAGPVYHKTEYQERILTSLYRLQNEGFLCDAEIQSIEGPVPLHRLMIVISDCKSFQKIIMAIGSSHEKISFNCSQFSKAAVQSLVRYFYTGEIAENPSEEFFNLCRSVELNDIFDTCNYENLAYVADVSKTVEPDESMRPTENCDKTVIKNSKTKLKRKGMNTRKRKVTRKKELTTTIKDKIAKMDDTEENNVELVLSSSSINNHKRKVPKQKQMSTKIKDNIQLKTDDTEDRNMELHLLTSMVIDEGSPYRDEISDDSQDRGDERANLSVEGETSLTDIKNQNPYYESPELDYYGRNRSKKRRLENAIRKEQNGSNNGLKRRTAKQKTRSAEIEWINDLDQDEIDNENEIVTDVHVDESDKGKTGGKRKRKVVNRWCHKCDKRFSEKELRKHLRNVHPPFTCKLCTWTGLLSRELALHMFNKHGMLVMPEKYPLLACDHKDCNFKTIVSYALERHKESHNRLTRHLCDVCGSSFATAGGLKEHSLRHAEENPVYKCQQCDQVFGWKCKLKSHELKVHGIYLLCEMCPYKTKYKDTLIMHLHYEHNQPLPDKKKIFHCEKCDFYCLNSSTLKLHELRHDGVKNHICSQCNKAYLTVHELKTHINTTHGDKRFNCHLCGYVAKRKTEINSHFKSWHSDVRPFSCDICGYTCKLKGNLQKHIRCVHKIEVVTRKSLHEKLLQTGKGYTDLLSVMKSREVLLGEKIETTTTDGASAKASKSATIEATERVSVGSDGNAEHGTVTAESSRNSDAVRTSTDIDHVKYSKQNVIPIRSGGLIMLPPNPLHPHIKEFLPGIVENVKRQGDGESDKCWQPYANLQRTIFHANEHINSADNSHNQT